MRAKKGPGRPALAPEERRAHRLVVMMTRAESEALDRLARAEGTSRSSAAARILSRALRRRGKV